MKRRLSKLTVAILMIAVSSRVHADNSLSFDVSAPSFQVATTGNKVSLVLRNSDGIKAIQLRAVSNTPGVTLREVQRADRTIDQDWTVQYHSVSEGRMNVLVANLGYDTFESGEGTVAELVFDVDESVVAEFFTLSLQEIKAADHQGRPVELLFAGDTLLAIANDVDVDFVINPLAVSLSIGNRQVISELRFEARIEGATVIAQPVLRGRAEGVPLSFELVSDRVVIQVGNKQGGSLKPGGGEILDIPIRSSHDVRLVVEGISLLGSDSTALSSQVSVTESVQQPQLFALQQNYPNPFNPSTTIAYELPTRSHVVLNIFNLLGQEVARLADEEKPAGRHEVEWRPTDVSSGVYFYRLSVVPSAPRDLVPISPRQVGASRDGQVGEYAEVRRMLLLR